MMNRKPLGKDDYPEKDELDVLRIKVKVGKRKQQIERMAWRRIVKKSTDHIMTCFILDVHSIANITDSFRYYGNL